MAKKIQNTSVIVETFDSFLQEHGLWPSWSKFLRDRGWSVEEMGMKDDLPETEDEDD